MGRGGLSNNHNNNKCTDMDMLYLLIHPQDLTPQLI